MARLAKDRLLCDTPRGAGRCRGVLGAVVEVMGDNGKAVRAFAVPPGWRKISGTWQEPERARERRLHGQPEKPLPSRLAAKKHGRSGPYLPLPAFVVNRREELRCRECGVDQSICVDDLGVDRSDVIAGVEL